MIGSPRLAVDPRTDGCDNEFPGRTGGRAAEGTGLLNRILAPENSTDDSEKAESPRLGDFRARRVRADPDLDELCDVWKLLDERIIAAIMALVRTK